MDSTAGRCTFELISGSLKVKAPGEEIIEQIAIIAHALRAVVLLERNELKGSKVTAADEKQDDASDFRAVLGSKLTATYNDKLVRFNVYSLGELSLPSGKIIAADAFMLDCEPFTRSVKPGAYPVTVAVADLGKDQRIAFAQIRFSNKHAAHWEIALRPGQDFKELKSNELFGYGVDSGTGCFADPAAQNILRAKGARALIDAAMDEMETVRQHTRSWVRIDTPLGGAAMFSSGFGDGFYASYFGLAESGEVVALVTDFAVVDWDARPRYAKNLA
jgi:hypothetical protein